MYIHPQLAQRLAQAKNQEARSRMQHAPELRAATLGRRTPAVTVNADGVRWAEATLASVTRRLALRRSLRTNAPRHRSGLDTVLSTGGRCVLPESYAPRPSSEVGMVQEAAHEVLGSTDVGPRVVPHS